MDLEELPEDTQSLDLFVEPQKQEPPSEGVFADTGEEKLSYLGEIQIPRPIPCELIIEIEGFDYYFKLDRREKQQ